MFNLWVRFKAWWNRDEFDSWLLSETARDLFYSPNILHVNDCSNKAGRYARALLDAGIKAQVLVIDDHHYKRATLHAVVEIEGKFYDPTLGRSTKNLKKWGSLAFIVSGLSLACDRSYQ